MRKNGSVTINMSGKFVSNKEKEKFLNSVAYVSFRLKKVMKKLHYVAVYTNKIFAYYVLTQEENAALKNVTSESNSSEKSANLGYVELKIFTDLNEQTLTPIGAFNLETRIYAMAANSTRLVCLTANSLVQYDHELNLDKSVSITEWMSTINTDGGQEGVVELKVDENYAYICTPKEFRVLDINRGNEISKSEMKEDITGRFAVYNKMIVVLCSKNVELNIFSQRMEHLIKQKLKIDGLPLKNVTLRLDMVNESILIWDEQNSKVYLNEA